MFLQGGRGWLGGALRCGARGRADAARRPGGPGQNDQKDRRVPRRDKKDGPGVQGSADPAQQQAATPPGLRKQQHGHLHDQGGSHDSHLGGPGVGSPQDIRVMLDLHEKIRIK